MAEGLSKKTARAKPVMNVTPLVDVVLVLLIIFMVIVPMLDHNVQVTLPSIFNIDEHNRGQADPFTLSISRDGRLFFEEELLDSGSFAERLRQANQNEPRRRLVLRADRQTRYAEVRNLFRVCQQIGFPGISLRVNQRGEDRGTPSS